MRALEAVLSGAMEKLMILRGLWDAEPCELRRNSDVHGTPDVGNFLKEDGADYRAYSPQTLLNSMHSLMSISEGPSIVFQMN